MPIPVALETLLGIIGELVTQELDHPRMASLDLVAAGEAAVGEVEAAAFGNRQIGQAAEGVVGAGGTGGGVLGVEIEDHAGPGVSRPGEDALVVALDKANSAVDDVFFARQQ